MENNGITETSISQISGPPITSKPSRDEDTRSIKRENDSMDDFEHLEHETSPNEESRLYEVKNVLDVTSAQLIDVPRPEKKMSVTEIVGGEEVAESGSLATSLASKLERNILDTSIPADERILQPVPATPPPSANYEQSVNVVRNEDVRRFSSEAAAPPSRDEEPPVKVHHEENECRATLESLPEPRMDAKAASLAFMEMERGDEFSQPPSSVPVKVSSGEMSSLERAPKDDGTSVEEIGQSGNERIEEHKWAIDSGIEDISVMTKSEDSPISQKSHDFISNIASSVLPVPEKSPEYDFLAGETSPNRESTNLPNETKNIIDDDTWNVVERPEAKITAVGCANGEIESSRRDRHVDDEAPTKPLPPLPKNEIEEEEDDYQSHARNNYPTREQHTHDDIYEMSNDYVGQTIGKTSGQQQQSGAETGDSEFESAPEQSPAKTSGKTSNETIGSSYHGRKADENDDIAPKEIFADMGLDAWFNPERLNPKVAALIYWRQPEKTGIVFGAILGVLLSLAYFSLISVFAYLSLLTLCGTVGFRVYKTFVQAVQKTSDGHPFKDILEVDLALPAEKVHEVADVAVAHANATVAELRRLFLVEDFIDSFKFGVGLWCLTYLGSWFNGMTLIIIGVVALFTLPKVYETNMAQIDQNVALVRGKINELTAKVKAAIPLGKKSEPTKEE